MVSVTSPEMTTPLLERIVRAQVLRNGSFPQVHLKKISFIDTNFMSVLSFLGRIVEIGSFVATVMGNRHKFFASLLIEI